MKTILSAVAILVLCTTALATDYYVGTAAAGDADGSTAANAYGSLADAFAGSVVAGDTVYMLQGTHTLEQSVVIQGALTIAADPAATADVVITNDSTTGNKIFFGYSSSSDNATLELTLQGLVFEPSRFGDLISFYPQSSLRRTNPEKYADLSIVDCEFDFGSAAGDGAGKEPISGEYRNISITNTVVKNYQPTSGSHFLSAEHKEEFRMEGSSFTEGTSVSGALFNLNGSSSDGSSSVVIDDFTISTATSPAEVGNVLYSDNNGDLSVSGVTFENVVCDGAFFTPLSVWGGAELSFSNITISSTTESHRTILVSTGGLYESGVPVTSIVMTEIDIDVSDETTSTGTILSLDSGFEVVDVTISECDYKGAMDSNDAVFAVYGDVSGVFSVDGIEASGEKKTTTKGSRDVSQVNLFYITSYMSGTVDIANVELFNFQGTNAFHFENPTSSVVNTTVVGGTFDNLVYTNDVAEVFGTLVTDGATVSESLFFCSGATAVLTVSDLVVENATLTDTTSGGGLAHATGSANFTTVNPIRWSQDLLPLNTSIFYSDNAYLYAEFEVYGCGDMSEDLPLASDISTYDSVASVRSVGSEKGANVTVAETRLEACTDDDDGDDDGDDSTDDDVTGSDEVSPASTLFAGAAAVMAVLVMVM